MRPVYFVLGCCFFGLGWIGVAVPGLPTVPFMLLALWAFSNSSRRLHDWLYEHPVFGPPLRRWQEHRVIPARAKLLAVVMMLLSFAYMALFTEAGGWVLVVTATVMLSGAAYILSKPSSMGEDRG